VAHPYYDVVQSQERWIRNGAHLNQKKQFQKQSGWIFDLCLERCMISPSSVLIKRELFDHYGGFDTDYPACEDYALWLKLSRFHPIGLDECVGLTKYGGHDDQLSFKYPNMDEFRVIALLDCLEREADPNVRNVIKTVLLKKAKSVVDYCQKFGEVEKAKDYKGRVAEAVNRL
jgi:hypothetical protein